ncbi:uncharacterized protein LOC109796428 [Cajanus cajan]|uniref:uncharacterized protein LOC109796428 n=1 Tax=Cajanus cajan TaxID=3821 RepID=UPI00098DBCEA|nr:uncharacterized protein LOC109796428 [Cajanus cajan]
MDQGRATRLHHDGKHSKICMEEHHHSDNGLKFTDKKLNIFLENLGIRHRFTSVEHPQSNGQAEVTNKVVLTELKKWLSKAKRAWAEEFPEVLWAYRCTPQSSTKETPFWLAYGSNAMILVEVGKPSFRRTHFHEESNDNSLRAELDVLDEVRDKARIVPENIPRGRSRLEGNRIGKMQSHQREVIGQLGRSVPSTTHSP